MTFRLTLGLDPGQTGAIAALADGVPVGFIDIPTLPRLKGGGNAVDAVLLTRRIRELLRQHLGAYTVAVIERVQNRPTDGSTQAFRFGQADGILRGVVGALGIGFVEVEPQTWKRHFGLLKTEKDDARLLAIRRFPETSLYLERKKDGGRADALLVALWAEETEAVAIPQRKDAPSLIAAA